MDSESWFPREWLGPVFARRLLLAAASPAAWGADSENNYEVDAIRQSYLRFLIERGEFADADRVYEAIPKESRGKGDLPRLVVLLRAREGKTSELIASFKTDPSDAPELKTIDAAADELRRDMGSEAERSRDKDAARSLREYVFARKLALNELAAPDYLALAQSRLESPTAKPDVAAALEVLHRMTMLPGDSYQNLDSAAGLLARSGRGAEAMPFLKVLADANPWQPEYRLRLAKLKLSLGQDGDAAAVALAAVAGSGDASYALRAESAETLREVPGAHNFASGELTLLASRSVTPAQADKPYFVRAREFAAAGAPVAARPGILLAAMEFAPGDRLRLALFKAEVAAGADERALAAVTPLLNDNRGDGYGYRDQGSGLNMYGQGDSADADGDAGADDGQDEASGDSDVASPVVMPAIASLQVEKLAFSSEVAKMYERLGQDGEAEAWLVEAGEAFERRWTAVWSHEACGGGAGASAGEGGE